MATLYELSAGPAGARIPAGSARIPSAGRAPAAGRGWRELQLASRPAAQLAAKWHAAVALCRRRRPTAAGPPTTISATAS